MNEPYEYGLWQLVLFHVALFIMGQDWQAIHKAQGDLVTDGIYGKVRHPQYAGIGLVIFGALIQWPTLPTLLMAPVLIGMYVRLARREDEELATAFSPTFVAYAARTPSFITGRPRRASRQMGEASVELAVTENVPGAEAGSSTVRT